MNVLHINVSAMCDKFYLYYYKLLKDRGIEQDVYTPYKKDDYYIEDIEWASTNYELNSIHFHSFPIKTTFDRFFYKKKIKKYFLNLEKNLEVKTFDIIHAHSLYSDGGVAYELYKKYSIPYIVAIRSTDTDLFMKYFKWNSLYVKKILDNAYKVIFISPDIKKVTIDRLYNNEVKNIKCIENSHVIPNGLEHFWINNLYDNRILSDQKINILQVSRLDRRKNIDKSIYSIAELKKKGINANLYIAGTGSQEKKLKKIIRINNLEDNVKLLGYVSDKSELLKLYRMCDIFLMPSQNETFGISYIEALTQGMPIIGLKGTGVSSYFDKNEVGYFIEKPSPTLITDAIEKIVKNYNSINKNCFKNIELFYWENIINKYIDMYYKAIEIHKINLRRV